ncbi:MAG: hypothetical protein ACOH1T_10920 [Microbacteriaceae bacterium]
MIVNNRIWVIGAAFIMVAILALGFFLGVAPRLEEIAKNEVQRQSVLEQNQVQEATLAGLKTDFEKITEYTARLAELQKAIPGNNDLSTFIGELHELEDKSGVVLTNFGSTDAQPFVLDLGLPEPEPAAPVEGAEAPTEPVEPVAPVLPPGTPVQTLDSAEFVVISIQLTVTGKQAAILNFVNNLQNGDRRFLVNTMNITIDNDGKVYTGVIEGYVYVLVDPRITADTEPPVEKPAEEEPEPTPTPTAGIPTETPAP